MASNPSAKFFCESCGAEVPRNARFCKKCGRFFASVRCPNCGATGSPDKFKKGCPECGYTVEGGAPDKAEKKRVSRKTKKGFFAALRSKSALFGTTAPSEDALPTWIYLLTASAVVVLFCIILRYFGR